MSQMQSLACSGYFYFPTKRAFSSCTEPIFINPVFFGCLLLSPLPREGAGRTRRCPWRSRSSKGSFVPACEGRAASSAHILTITLLTLKSICARRCGPWSLSLTFFPTSCFSFVYTKVKIDNYFFTRKNTLKDKDKCLFLPTDGWNFWLLHPL